MYARADGNASFRHCVGNPDADLSFGENAMDTSDIVMMQVDDVTSKPQPYESQDSHLTCETRHYQFEGATCIDNDESLIAQESAEDGIVTE